LRYNKTKYISFLRNLVLKGIEVLPYLIYDLLKYYKRGA